MPDLSPLMTLLQIIELRPEAVEVFRRYEQITGSCLLCSNLFDSLASVADQYELKIDALLAQLEGQDETGRKKQIESR